MWNVISVISGIIGVLIGSFISNISALKKIKMQKMEETSKIIHELIDSIEELISLYKKKLFLRLEQRQKSNDLATTLKTKIVYCNILIQMYIGKLESFSRALQLIIGKNGFIQQKKHAESQFPKKISTEFSASSHSSPEEKYLKLLTEANSLLSNTQDSLIKKIQPIFWWDNFLSKMSDWHQKILPMCRHKG